MMVTLMCLSLLISTCLGAETFRFANYYGDHMVLQRGDKMAKVWGYIPQCDAITVEMNGVSTVGTCAAVSGVSMWSVMLPPQSAGGPYVITVSSSKYGKISLKDVMFGDVWICSGQSNMGFTVEHVFNATEEITKADKYPHLRLLTIQRVTSSSPKMEPPGIQQPWCAASHTTVPQFSATCWFYAKNIFDRYNIPMGLVFTAWGGTPIEAWSSPASLAKCKVPTARTSTLVNEGSLDPSPHEHSVLWNAMIYPLLPMTIKGAIWYQGEANSGNPALYNCTFPEMINDWRMKWSSATKQTDPMFPFGFVQLAAVGTDNKTVGGFPGVRWSQTASYGYVPNPAMQNVFMAVAMDLGDPTSPYGSVHPRDKEDVGSRLALAGSAIAYGTTGLYYTGPLVKAFLWTPTPPGSPMSAMITFTNLAPGEKLEQRSQYGFEIGCANANSTAETAQYLEGTANFAQDNEFHVWFPYCDKGYEPKYVRYAWREDPCPAKKCAVYSGGLPSPPFMMAT